MSFLLTKYVVHVIVIFLTSMFGVLAGLDLLRIEPIGFLAVSPKLFLSTPVGLKR
jgi:hypothetical protein